ncbi:lysozyme inhibitor LprI family protein [Devosia sp. 63-57]|uniref:lysozyme inhibitor LprI family protein n=1 Tax=Devosia sp. 63-57 TaxID=1895751 RepID=UPI00086D8FC0|nr:lysozyme inhibitor LprI family protein [Devosia sp. 63-57]ODT47495.1 MAG: hypothetical protein ABS74_14610 [Pelagibacterium sp. SCN 63-126]ODU86125.1 MAG: hypothetical protein ABT14_10045 [Pelagibacterium sp. SCN 63-17]OJX42797.1 MAG: hypothetical protein BGO80_15255 [Devosia sp. 63-57]
MLKRYLFVLPMLLLISPGQADDVLDELSARSHVPVGELEDILADCETTQMAMNLCAFYDFVEADMNLEKIVQDNAEGMSKTETKAYLDEIAAWRSEAEGECNAAADEEAEGGSMRPMVYSYCMQEKLDQRATEEVEG